MVHNVECVKKLVKSKSPHSRGVLKSVQSVPLQSRYGWCTAGHSSPQRAQSGYDGLCKVCYRAAYPDLYAMKVASRKKCCGICGNMRELVQRDLCRPCYRSRLCDGCGSVNRLSNATSCIGCSAGIGLSGTVQTRLAVWCSDCYGSDDLISLLCSACLRKSSSLHTQTYTHAYTHVYTHAHTCIRTHMHTHPCRCTHTHTRPHVRRLFLSRIVELV